MNQFDQIENRIKGIVEKGSTLLHGLDQNTLLINRFSEGLHQYLLENPSCLNNSPSDFIVYLSSETQEIWERQQEWETTFLALFNAITIELNCRPSTLPVLTLVVRNSLDKEEVAFEVEDSSDRQEKTGIVSRSHPPRRDRTENHPTSVKLLLNMTNAVPLTKAVINLGRKSDNDIVITDLRVSRFHAQIRKTKDGYMVFDVGSSGGTFVNGERITRQFLKAGDVISLAGYPLIFSSENEDQIESEKEITANLKNTAGGRE